MNRRRAVPSTPEHGLPLELTTREESVRAAVLDDPEANRAFRLLIENGFNDRMLLTLLCQEAMRTWAESWDAGSAKIGKNLYFLVKSFEDSGNTACSIESKPQESPDFESKEILIHCGRRMITIGVSKYKEQHEETQVSETVK
jgi:hypothetical protein